MPFDISTQEARARLDVRDKPYYQVVGKGLHVGYRKGKTRSAWVIRWRDREHYKSLTIKDAVPDDRQIYKGARIMSFHEALEVAMDQGVYYCSFCKKSSKEVEKLVAGPNVFICNECVKLCQFYMDNPEQQGSDKTGWKWPGYTR